MWQGMIVLNMLPFSEAYFSVVYNNAREERSIQ
jgi:hypothetical protein